MAGHHRRHKTRRNIVGNDLGTRLRIGYVHRDRVLDTGKLGRNRLKELGCRALHLSNVAVGHHDDSLRLTRDGVAQASAVNRAELHVTQTRDLAQQTEQQTVGICPLADDLYSRVSTLASAYVHAQRRVSRCGSRRSLIRQTYVGVKTAGTSYVELSFGLRIEVQQYVTLEQAGL